MKLRYSTTWADSDHEVAWFQHIYSNQGSSLEVQRPAARAQCSLEIKETPTELSVVGADFAFTFDRARGHLVEWTSAGITLLAADPTTHAAIIPGFNRPPTDNDRPNAYPYWKRFGIPALTSQLRSLDVIGPTDESGEVKVKTELFLAPPVLAWGWECEIDYTITPSGRIVIDAKRLEPKGNIPSHIPRVGLDLRLNAHLDQIKWFGLGPGESYPDKKTAQRTGVFSAPVKELETPYDVPQEYGNRMETRWVDFTGQHLQGRGFRAIRVDSHDNRELFSFVAKRHSDRNITESDHPCDLFEEEATLVRLDTEIAGVGTGACGPAVREDLMVSTKTYAFKMVLEAL